MNQNKRHISPARSLLLSAMALGLAVGSSAVPAAPDDDGYQQEATATVPQKSANGLGFKYLWLAGSTFIPVSSTSEYSYPGGGCISKTGGSSMLFAHKVMLPAGTTAKYVRLYAYDDSVSDEVSVYFTTYNASGAFNELTTVASSTTGGHDSVLSPELDYVVNPGAAPINIVANLGSQNDSTLRFCGVRIAYFDAPLPNNIFRNGFE